MKGKVLQSKVIYNIIQREKKQCSSLESLFKEKDLVESFQKFVEMKNQSDKLRILKEQTNAREHGIRG